MLRSGYSSDVVVRELSVRRFGDEFNDDVEKQLETAGASPALIHALRTGLYQLSPTERAAIEQRATARQQTRAPDDPPVGSVPLEKRESAPTQALPPGPGDVVYRMLKGDLVSRQNGVISHFDDEATQSKKLFIFFFSANWLPPGRKFTPRLVEYYQRVIPQHPEVEVIFFSVDRSQFGMETYVNQSSMPWPAVSFPLVGRKSAGIDPDLLRDLPCLLLVDGAGRILGRSGAKPGSGTLDEALADFEKIIGTGSSAQAARAP